MLAVVACCPVRQCCKRLLTAQSVGRYLPCRKSFVDAEIKSAGGSEVVLACTRRPQLLQGRYLNQDVTSTNQCWCQLRVQNNCWLCSCNCRATDTLQWHRTAFRCASTHRSYLLQKPVLTPQLTLSRLCLDARHASPCRQCAECAWCACSDRLAQV